jgi:hypothetical protein
MRFSIRDLLWATVVVAMGLGWWADNQNQASAALQAHRLRATLYQAKISSARLHDIIGTLNHRVAFFGGAIEHQVSLQDEPVDWGILDEPLIER